MLYWRYITTAMASAVIMILQGTQISIDVVTEYMLKDTKPSNWSYSFLTPDLFHIDKDGKRAVSHVSRLLMLHVTYFGSLLVFLLLFSPIFWKRRPSRWFLLISMVMVTTCVAIAPLAIKSKRMLYLDRCFLGSGSATIYPLIFDHLVLWIPPQERGAVCSLVYGGMPLSVALTIWFTDVICQHLKWVHVFYLGLLFIAPVGLSLYFTSPTPQLHRFVSDEEENYIANQFLTEPDTNERRRRLKLKTLFSWRPFLATLYATFCYFWGWNVILFVLPLYLEHIHGIKVQETTSLAALPFLTSWLVGITCGIVMDVLIRRDIVSATMARRICVWTSCVVPMLCFSVLNVVGTTLAICLVWTVILSWGAGLAGVFSNFMDVAPNFGGNLMVFAVGIMSLSFFFVFIAFHVIMDIASSLSYRIIFSLTSVLYATEACVCLCISAKEAPWNSPEDEN